MRTRRFVARGVIATLLGATLAIVAADAAGAVNIRCHNTLPVSAGVGNMTYGLEADATLWSWGSNYFGELGIGSSGNSQTAPVHLASFGSLVAVSGGGNHALGLKDDGTVWAWGWNGSGQLGDGTRTDRLTPRQVWSLTGITSVFAGSDSSFAIKDDGTVWAWGRNDVGQLGDGTFTDRLVPVQIPALTGVTSIAPSWMFTLALKPDNTVLSWGRNGSQLQLGRGSTYTNYPTPGLVKGSGGTGTLGSITRIAAGGSHSLALSSNNQVWAWGMGGMGQLGTGSATDRNFPTRVIDSDGVGNLSSVAEVSGGGYFSVVRKTDGTLWSFGQNTYGELGRTGTAQYQAIPVQVATVTGMTLADAGGNHSVALQSDGDIYTWGANWDGGIGNGTTTHRLTPYLTTVDQDKPATPTELEAVAGEKLAYLTWTKPTSVVTQYVVTPYKEGVAQTPVETNSPKQDHAVRDLLKDTSYSFSVEAQNCLGAGTATAQSKKVVPTDVQLNDAGLKVEETSLTDRLSLRVNTFNGNLSIVQSDLSIAGTGLNFDLVRRWNSRGSGASVFGNRWASTLGSDLSTSTNSDGTVILHTPGGTGVGFVKNASGIYETPAGTRGTLSLDDAGTPSDPSDDTYKLKGFEERDTLVFSVPNGRMLRQEDRNGNSISYGYDGSGVLTSVTDTQNRTVNLTYTSGRITRVTDVIGREVNYTYDANGNLTHALDAEGGDTTFTYDATTNDLTKAKTPAGREVTLTYDANKRVQSLKWNLAPGTPMTTFTYGQDETTVTDARAKATKYRFDPVGRTKAVTDALGNVTSLEYTSTSNVRRATSPRGGQTSFGYTNNALSSATIPTGAASSAQYSDPNHPQLPTRFDDPENNRKLLTYDTAGNLVRVKFDQLAAQNQVDVAYNSRGLKTSVTDARGKVTTYGYDASGNLTTIDPPGPLGSVSITYDPASRPTTVTDGKGQTTTYEYDDLDRVVKVTRDDGSTVERVYDGDGHLTREVDASGESLWTYDTTGRLASETVPGGAITTYGYDAAGNLTSVAEPIGSSTYTYNAVNLVDGATFSGGVSVGFSYDANYNRTAIDYPQGVRQTFVYDASNRIMRVSAVKGSMTVSQRDYTYANPATGNADAGKRYTVTELDGTATTYTYDVLNRLTSATRRDAGGSLVSQHGWTYDGAGNRLTQAVTRPSAAGPLTDPFTYTYDDANQLVDVNGRTYTYDLNGNVTGSSSGAVFAYDAANRTALARGDGGSAEQFLYQGAGQADRHAAGPVAEHVSTGGLCAAGTCAPLVTRDVATKTFTSTVLGVSSETTAGVTTAFFRDPSGVLLAQQTGTTSQYLLRDAIGSITTVIDGTTASNAGVLATYEYDPFGVLTESTGVRSITPWRFAGYYQDSTGLYKAGERYYDPALGRWTQQDPIHDPFDPKQWNRYVYVGNDPVNFTDPSGLKGQKKQGCHPILLAGDDDPSGWEVVWEGIVTVAHIGATAGLLYACKGNTTCILIVTGTEGVITADEVKQFAETIGAYLDSPQRNQQLCF